MNKGDIKYGEGREQKRRKAGSETPMHDWETVKPAHPHTPCTGLRSQ